MCGTDQAASAEPRAGPRGEERAKCVRACAGTQGWRHCGKVLVSLRRASGAGGEGAPGLAWDVIGEHHGAAPGTRRLLCPSLGCWGTGVGTEGGLQGDGCPVARAVAVTCSSRGAPVLRRQLLPAAAVSRVQSEHPLPGLTQAFLSPQGGRGQDAAQHSYPLGGEGVSPARDGHPSPPPSQQPIVPLLCRQPHSPEHCGAGGGGLPFVPSCPLLAAPRHVPSWGSLPSSCPSPEPGAAPGPHPCAGPAGSQGSGV